MISSIGLLLDGQDVFFYIQQLMPVWTDQRLCKLKLGDTRFPESTTKLTSAGREWQLLATSGSPEGWASTSAVLPRADVLVAVAQG